MARMENTGEPQLTLEFTTHPALAHQPGGGTILGALKLAIDVSIDRDLNRGDELLIQIGDADGTRLATCTAVVVAAGGVDLTDRGEVVGTLRVHNAKLV